MTSKYVNDNLNNHATKVATTLSSLKKILAEAEALHAASDFQRAKGQLALLKAQLSCSTTTYRNWLATRERVARISQPQKVPVALLDLFIHGGLSRFAAVVFVADGFDHRVCKLPDDAGARCARELAAKGKDAARYTAAAAWLAGEAGWVALLPEPAVAPTSPSSTALQNPPSSRAHMAWVKALDGTDEVGLSDENGPIAVLGPTYGTGLVREGRSVLVFGKLKFRANGTGLNHAGWLVPASPAHLQAQARRQAEASI